MDNNNKSNIDEMEIIISNFLRAGVIISALIVSIGLSMFLITGSSGYADNLFPYSPSDIMNGAIHLKSYAIIMLGIIVLILTPVFRVGVSILVFIKEKDYLYVKITFLVFAILIISFLLGKVE